MLNLNESISMLEAALEGALPGEIGLTDDSKQPSEYKKFMKAFMPDLQDKYDKHIESYMVIKWSEYFKSINKQIDRKTIKKNIAAKTIRFIGFENGSYLINIQYELDPSICKKIPTLKAKFDPINKKLKIVNCVFS